jgi:hypothetical protein
MTFLWRLEIEPVGYAENEKIERVTGSRGDNPIWWYEFSGTGYQYGTSKPSYSDLRGARYLNEQPEINEVLPLKEVFFDIRADIFAVFMRWAYPSVNGTGNPLQPA